MRYVTLFLVAGLAAACDQAADPSQDATRDGTEYPTASYGRQLLFLSDEGAAPVAAIFDFTMAADTTAVQRTARAWLGRDGGWIPFLNLSWAGEPMREPWRLLPHGPLRLVVGAGDELEALDYRVERGFRLRPSRAFAEWSPTASSRFRLRQAELRLDGQQLAGVVLDSQSGALSPTAGGAEEAFITDGRELHLVIAAPEPGAGAPAWLRLRGGEETWDAVSLMPDSAGTTWMLFEPQGLLHGELRTIGGALSVPLPSQPEPGAPPRAQASGANGVYVVNGWIDLRGVRYQVFGLVRRGPR